MKLLGTQILLELEKCDPDTLDNLDKIKQCLTNAASKAGANIIGETFHKEPNVLHYGKGGTGEKIKTGMIFTIEPMINLGDYETKTLKDGWTAVTKDKSLSAQFEHTIGITKDGYEIFTQSNKDKSN